MPEKSEKGEAPHPQHARRPEYVTTRDVADATGRTIRAVQIWCKKGKLPAIKVEGGHWLVRADWRNHLTTA